VRRECGTLSQSCDTGMIIIVPRMELDPGGEKWEHRYRRSIELTDFTSDHSPDCVVRLSWQLNLRRQV